MAKQSRVFSTETLADNATVAATEEVIATLAGVTPSTRDDRIRLTGTAHIIGAAGATDATLRVRRDSLTGAVVGEAALDFIDAANDTTSTVQAEDTSRGEGSFTYVLTVETGGAACTVASAHLTALVG